MPAVQIRIGDQSTIARHANLPAMGMTAKCHVETGLNQHFKLLGQMKKGQLERAFGSILHHGMKLRLRNAGIINADYEEISFLDIDRFIYQYFKAAGLQSNAMRLNIIALGRMTMLPPDTPHSLVENRVVVIVVIAKNCVSTQAGLSRQKLGTIFETIKKFKDISGKHH
jgi:hypothetical protein